MYPIAQSTAITVPFFVHDVSGDAVTGLVDAGFTKRISKNGAAFAAMTVTITEMENGWYSIPLSATHSNTLGLLSVLFTHASSKQVNLQFRVHARLPDDLAFPTVSGRSLDVAATGEAGVDFGNILGTLDAADIGADAITGAKIAPGAIAKGDQLTGLNDLTSAQVNTECDTALTDYDAVIPADLNDPTEAVIAAAVWDLDATAHQTLGTFGKAIGDPLADTDTIYALINSNLDAAITSRAVAGDAMALTAAAVDDVWDEVQSGHVTAGTFGRFLDSQLATAQSDLDDIQTRLPAALVGGRMASNAEVVGDKTGYTLTTADQDTIVDKVWDELRSAHVGAGSFGEGSASVQGDVTGEVGSLGTTAKADVNAEVVDVLRTDTIAELTQAAPPAAPTMAEAVMLSYMALRNKLDVDASFLEVHNNAGTVITKKALSDDGTTYSEAEMIAGT